METADQHSRKARIYLDNEAVATAVQELIIKHEEGEEMSSGKVHRDLFNRARECIKRNEKAFYRITWTKGHATENDAQEGVTQEWLKEGNDKVDEMARKAVEQHHNLEELREELEAFKKRAAFAATQQSMLTEIWMFRRDILINKAEEEKKSRKEEMRRRGGNQPPAQHEENGERSSRIGVFFIAFLDSLGPSP